VEKLAFLICRLRVYINMPDLLKISNSAKVSIDRNCSAKFLPYDFKYFTFVESTIGPAGVYFEKIVTVPSELDVPILVKININYVDDYLLINDIPILGSGAGPTLNTQKIFSLYERSFKLGVMNLNTHVYYDLDISFLPISPYYYQYVNTSF